MVQVFKALVAALGLRNSTKNRLVTRAMRRWSGVWVLILVFDIIRIVHRRQHRVIARRKLRDGEVLIISSSVSREGQ